MTRSSAERGGRLQITSKGACKKHGALVDDCRPGAVAARCAVAFRARVAALVRSFAGGYPPRIATRPGLHSADFDAAGQYRPEPADQPVQALADLSPERLSPAATVAGSWPHDWYPVRY